MRKIDNEDTFYLMITQSDRHNQALVKKLIPVLEGKEIDVAVLHFPLEQKGTDDEMNRMYETLVSYVKDLSVPPAVSKITKGKAEELLKGNISAGNIEKAFQKQSG